MTARQPAGNNAPPNLKSAPRLYWAMIDMDEWGTVYNSNLIRIRASPDKTQILIDIKEQNALDDHTYMVKNILSALLRADIKTLNVDHVRWAGKQRTLPLDFENVRVDFNIYYKKTEVLVEVKTYDTVLADRTREQLSTLIKHRQNIGLVVPQAMLKKADLMLKLNRLYPKVQLIAYENILEDPRGQLGNIITA